MLGRLNETPTGTVTFMEGMGTLSVGVGTFSTTTLSTGTHSITAVYSSDTNCRTSTSPVLKQKVRKSASVSAAVVAAVGPAGVGTVTVTTNYDGVLSASASASSRLVVGLGSVDGLSGRRPAVDRWAGSGDPRPTVRGWAESGDPRPTVPPAPVVDLAIGTLQDGTAVTAAIDELAVDVIAVRARRRVR